MNRPPIRTMVLGHPVVTCLGVGSGLTCAAAAWNEGDNGWMLSLVFLGVVAAVAKANEAASAYKRWKREWDAMAEPVARKRYGILSWLCAVAICLGAFVFVCQDAATRQATIGIAMLLAAPDIVGLGIRWLWRRRGTRRVSTPAQPVTVIARPLIAVPSLERAYAALPEHCQRILSSRPER